MKAIRFHEHGDPSVLKYEDIDEPNCGPGEAVLEVKAAGINHLDIWVRRGLPGVKIPLPRIPGCDAAGLVKEVAAGVTNVKAGDRVLLNPATSCGQCEFCAGGEMSMCLKYAIWGEHVDGTYRERIAVPARTCIPIPDGMTFEDAAAVPLAFLTAWRMLISKGKLKAGEDVLIHGIGAGVGVACLQIAKLSGARVIGTAGSQDKIAKAKALGADVLINYRDQDFVKEVKKLTGKRGVDMVVDYIGKDTWVGSLRSLRRGGRLVTCGATTGHDPTEDLRHIFFRQLDIRGSTMGTDRDLAEVLRCVFSGKIKPVVHEILPMKDAARAHQLIQDRKVFGKLILCP